MTVLVHMWITGKRKEFKHAFQNKWPQSDTEGS